MTDAQQKDPGMCVWLTLVLIHIELNFGAATELSAGQCAAIASDCELEWHAALGPPTRRGACCFEESAFGDFRCYHATPASRIATVTARFLSLEVLAA